MNIQMTAIYCLCNDFFEHNKAKQNQWHNEKMSDAEIMTRIIVASRFFMALSKELESCLKSISIYLKC